MKLLFVLCQDCLAVRPYSRDRDDGVELCRCGGEFCGCTSCNLTVHLLRAGIRDAYLLGAHNNVPGYWNETTGTQER